MQFACTCCFLETVPDGVVPWPLWYGVMEVDTPRQVDEYAERQYRRAYPQVKNVPGSFHVGSFWDDTRSREELYHDLEIFLSGHRD